MLEFWTEEGDEVRILWSWMREKEKVRNWIKKAEMLWVNVRRQLKCLSCLRGDRGGLFRRVWRLVRCMIVRRESGTRWM